MNTHLAAAAPNQLASDAALEVCRAGGNAVDGAVAACLVAMVTEPGIVSLGGGAFATVAMPGHAPVTVDGNVEMPGRGAPATAFGRGAREVTTSYGGGVTMTIGHGSVATPGALAALAEAHRRFGAAPWREVLAPAVEVARTGFPLGAASAYYLDLVHEQVFDWQPEGRAAMRSPDGDRLLRAGETMRVPGLADALQRIADVGADDFYRGELAAALVEDMGANGGLLGAEDLREYQVQVRPALPVAAGQWSLHTNPPPSIGGPVLAALLMLAEDSPASGPDAARWMVQVQTAVLRHRAEHLDVALDRRAAAQAMLDAIAAQGSAWLRAAPSTVHVSVVDDAGAACAITASSGYGSGVVLPGTGIWMNNCLGEPELNRRGLHGWEPGTRLPSNMAPTVGRRGDDVLAIGSPGADRITTALAQVLLALGSGADLPSAVAAARLHVSVSGQGLVVDHEDDVPLPPLDVPTRTWPRHSMFFGGVTAALRTATGELVAAADPRRGGGTSVTT